MADDDAKPKWFSNFFTMSACFGIDLEFEQREVSFVLATRHKAEALESFVKSLGDLETNVHTRELEPSEALWEFLLVVKELVGWVYEGEFYRVGNSAWGVVETDLPDPFVWEFMVYDSLYIDDVTLNMDTPHFDEFFAMLPCGPMTKSAAKQ